MDIPLVLNDKTVRQGLMGYKRKSSTISYKADVAGHFAYICLRWIGALWCFIKGESVMRLKSYVLLILLFGYCHQINADDYYQRHYIVLVDQTGSSMDEDPDGLLEVGKILSNLFLGYNLEKGVDRTKINATETYLADLIFNPETDEISIFKFGITGNGNDLDNKNYGLGRIRSNVRLGKNELMAFTDEFVIPVAQFRKSEEDISSFVKNHLTPLFCGKGINPGMNYSSIAFPCVLKRVESAPASSEYYVIIVSNFKVQGKLDNRADYGTILTAMNAKSYNTIHSEAFAKQLWQLNAPFYTSELIKIQSLKAKNDDSNQIEHIQSVKARCFKLGVKSLQGVSTYITSNLKLEQTSYGSNVFTLSPVSIAFTRDKYLDVNSIRLSISDSDNNVIFEKSIDNARFDPVEKKYILNNFEIPFKKEFTPGDLLHFKYVFYTTPKDMAGNAILPYVFLVDRDFEFTNDNFKNPLILSILMYLFVFAIVVALLVWLYVLIQRGRNNKSLYVELEHSDADEGSFHHVSREKGSLLLKCDYPRNGVSKINYTLQGCIENKTGKAIPWGVNYLYMKASLIDSPEGMSIKIADAKSEGWMYVLVKKSNRFTVELQVDFSNCLDKVKDVKVWLQWKFEPVFPVFGRNVFVNCGIPSVACESDFVNCYESHTQEFKDFLENVQLTYSDGCEVIRNFIREPFKYPDHWVGIDPGTSGSCITIGYGVGANAQDPNIVRVTTKDRAGKEKEIINSLIVIKSAQEETPDENISHWSPGKEYEFGILPYDRLDEYISEGAYCYQSIKKLLGYKKGGKDGRIKATINGKHYEFTGLDLQSLLVRALTQKTMADYIDRLKTDGTLALKKNCIFPDGEVELGVFQRAVVAIPNNYQLPQIIDMVESVKANGFEEVKYIYEPEGILCHYLKETYRGHKLNEVENIIVFDMGGATINATVFNVDIRIVNEQPEYHVSTLSRLGYAVGGDDIDYAIIEYLMHFEHISSIFNSDSERYKWQDENKTHVVKIAQEFKKTFVQLSDNLNVANSNGIIDDINTESLSSLDQFVAVYLNTIIQLIDKNKTFMSADLTDAERRRFNGVFSDCIKHDLLHSFWMKEYVYNKVEDAVIDMMSTKDVSSVSRIHKIIYSGRSTMFPDIKETIRKRLKKNSRVPEEYPLNGDLKSPVADGACWYGIFEGKLVFLDNSRVTSSYGFCYTTPGGDPYHELITQNSKYEDKNNTEISREAEVKSKFNSDAGHVNFYQVMGALNHGNSLFDESNRHKVRFLNSINLAGSTANKEIITVCANGQVICDVDYPGKPSTQGLITAEFDARDITKENARPYLFSVSDSEKHLYRPNISHEDKGYGQHNGKHNREEKKSNKRF